MPQLFRVLLPRCNPSAPPPHQASPNSSLPTTSQCLLAYFTSYFTLLRATSPPTSQCLLAYSTSSYFTFYLLHLLLHATPRYLTAYFTVPPRLVCDLLHHGVHLLTSSPNSPPNFISYFKPLRFTTTAVLLALCHAWPQSILRAHPR